MDCEAQAGILITWLQIFQGILLVICHSKLFLPAKLRWKAEMLAVDFLIAACKNKAIVCKRVNCILSNVCPSIYHKKRAFLSTKFCFLFL